MTKEKADELMGRIEGSKFFKRYGLQSHYMVSTTLVYPITHWVPTKRIEIKVNSLADHSGMTNSFKAMFNKLAKEFGLTEWFYAKNDGSCPQEYIIYYE